MTDSSVLVCPAGYTFDSGSCYRTGLELIDWFTAEAACEADARGAHLAVIDTPAEALVLERFQPGPADFGWVGASDVVTEGVYLTVTNRPMTFLAWEPGEPSGGGQNCLVSAPGATVADFDCTSGDEYICEYDGIPAASPAWGLCPAGYTFVAPGCYRSMLSGAGTTWLASELACEADGPGSHLVVLDSLAEAMAVDEFVPGTILDHWVGASDLVNEGVFPSVTNGAFGFVTFAAGEPDGSTAENCLLFSDAVELASADCAGTDDFVCEYDGILAVPAAWGQ